jgi:hypothetical protein
LLAITNQTLTSTQNSLAATNQTLTSTQNSLAAANQNLDQTRSQLAATNQTANYYMTAYNDTLQQLNLAQQTLSGLGIVAGSSVSYSQNNSPGVTLNKSAAAALPTWSQLQAFLVQDHTEDHPYVPNEYYSYRYAMDVFNGAQAAGIQSAYVTLSFPGEASGYALNAFVTSDFGLVYVDCTQAPDKIARVESGKTYLSVDASSVPPGSVRNDAWWESLQTSYYLPSSSDQNVKLITGNISIYW